MGRHLRDMLAYLTDKWSASTRPAPTTAQFTDRAGLDHESHTVETSDGYVLGLSRILPRRRPYTEHRQPSRPLCLIVHGLMSCSDFFVCQLPNEALGEPGRLENISLPFYLVSQGYDVWLLNNRGARYSDRHRRHALESEAFWDFSWIDMAELDLPESIEYVLRVTGQGSLSVCAFSQGAAQVLAATSLLPSHRLSSKIRLLMLFSPVLVPRLLPNPLSRFFFSRPNLVARVFGVKSLMWPVEVTRRLTPDWLFAWICYTVSGYLFGWRMDHMTGRERSVMYQNIASTTSVKVLRHWLDVASAQSFIDRHGAEMKCLLETEAGLDVFAVFGADDALPDDALFRAWFDGKRVEVLSVDEYEHIETIWGRDWGIKVRPLVRRMIDVDMEKWREAGC